MLHLPAEALYKHVQSTLNFSSLPSLPSECQIVEVKIHFPESAGNYSGLLGIKWMDCLLNVIQNNVKNLEIFYLLHRGSSVQSFVFQ